MPMFSVVLELSSCGSIEAECEFEDAEEAKRVIQQLIEVTGSIHLHLMQGKRQYFLQEICIVDYQIYRHEEGKGEWP